MHEITIPIPEQVIDGIPDPRDLPDHLRNRPESSRTILEMAFADQKPHAYAWKPGSGIVWYDVNPADYWIAIARRNLDAATLRRCLLDRLIARALPPLEPGERVDFTLRALPTRRPRDPRTDRPTEIPVAPAGATFQERDQAYSEWLHDLLQRNGSAEITHVWLEHFGNGTISGARSGKPAPLMYALLSGELRVNHPSGFCQLLRSGIRRHRNRGYGLILINS